MTVHAQGPYRSAPLSAPEVQRAPRGVRWVALIVAASLVCGGLRGVVVQRSKRHVAVQQRAALIGAPVHPRPRMEALRGVTEFVDARRCVRARGGAYCWGELEEWAQSGDDYDVAYPADSEAERPRAPAPSDAVWAAWMAQDPSARQGAHERGACRLTLTGEVWCSDLASGQEEQIERVPDLGLAISLSTVNEAHCAVTEDGGVRCWVAWSRITHAITQFDAPVMSVALGLDELCTLDQERRVRCVAHHRSWTDADRVAQMPAPQEQTALRGARAIASMGAELCAITEGAQVFCWDRMGGTLGRGDLKQARRPGAVEGLTDVTSVALGSTHACALTRDGRVRCWGSNRAGERGDEDSSAERAVQAPIEGLYDVAQIEARGGNTCARTRRGEVWCWNDGSLWVGNRPERRSSRPLRVAFSFAVTEIAMVYGYLCARSDRGEVWCGSHATEDAPHAVPGVVAAQQVVGDRGQMCALLRGGEVACWSAPDFDRRPPCERPVRLPFAPARSLAAGSYDHRLCALRLDGRVECLRSSPPDWDWTQPDSLTPTDVPALRGVTQIVMNQTDAQIYGIDREGTVVTLESDPARGLRGVQALRARDDFGCAVHQDGTVSCWGTNASGRLGRGATHPELPAPVRVFSQVQQ